MSSDDDLKHQFAKTRDAAAEMARMLGERAKEAASGAAQSAREAGETAARNTMDQIRERPLLATGLAFGAGALLARRLGRKGRRV
jgi:ElaB/YqjD/DUF883 family membrane-anchored ribosome-binding protein